MITTGTPPSTSRSHHELSAGRVSAIWGVRREIRSMSARPVDPGFAGEPAVQARVGRAAEGGRRRSRSRTMPSSGSTTVRSCSSVDEAAAARRMIRRGQGRSRRRGHARHGQAERLGDAAIVLAAVLAQERRRGARRTRARSDPRLMRPVAWRRSPVDVLDRDIGPEAARPDRHEHGRQVEPDHRQHHRRQRLVAAPRSSAGRPSARRGR